MAKTTREFAITLNSDKRKGKIMTRDKLLSLCISIIGNTSNILTLPSIYWEFEKLLLKQIKDKSINIHSFEYDWKLFCVACLNIPKSRSSSIKQIMSKSNYQKIKVNHFDNQLTLHHINVFDYLKETNKLFDFMWIDLTCPVDHIIEDVDCISDKLNDNGVCVISFLKGRERIKIIDRVKLITDRLSNFTLVESFEYVDTVCMVNVILQKQ